MRLFRIFLVSFSLLAICPAGCPKESGTVIDTVAPTRRAFMQPGSGDPFQLPDSPDTPVDAAVSDNPISDNPISDNPISDDLVSVEETADEPAHDSESAGNPTGNPTSSTTDNTPGPGNTVATVPLTDAPPTDETITEALPTDSLEADPVETAPDSAVLPPSPFSNAVPPHHESPWNNASDANSPDFEDTEDAKNIKDTVTAETAEIVAVEAMTNPEPTSPGPTNPEPTSPGPVAAETETKENGPPIEGAAIEIAVTAETTAAEVVTENNIPEGTDGETAVVESRENTGTSSVAPEVSPSEEGTDKDLFPDRQVPTMADGSKTGSDPPPSAGGSQPEIAVEVELRSDGPNVSPGGAPYDPVVENGRYFVDWPTPKAAIVFTGNMNGYVEPCGCAGIARMKGGLSRRHTFIKELEAKKWPLITVDAGNLIKGFGLQEEYKFQFVTDESLRLMKYDAAGIGGRELLFPTDSLLVYTVDMPGNPKQYTSANLGVFDFDPSNVAPFRIVKRGGVTVGITSVLGKSFQSTVDNNSDLVLGDPVSKLREILPRLAAQQCDYRILIVHGEASEAEAINRELTGAFQFIVTSDTPAEPPRKPIFFPDDAYRIEVGEKGKFAVVLGLYDDPAMPIRYQRVAFDSRYVNSPEVLAAMQCYQDTLRMIGLKGLGIKPVPDRLAPVNGKYVGSQSCADCHEASHRVWKKSKHAAAWAGIKTNSTPARDYDAECIGCHVVGWNPQEMIPFESGFLGEEETPHLANVGCESCHGPGEVHVRAEMGNDKELQEKLRAAVRLPLAEAMRTCVACHDGDNSPAFHFDTYWPQIEHREDVLE
ncbi:MAG TPA: hypothetical protein DEB39_04480 [Planctomycetaceae bacterium]|nr:hypothetical protein [Planctomycetaceae bacterium]